MIRITKKAGEKLGEIMAKEGWKSSSLRIAAIKSGCMGGKGYSYRLGHDDAKEGDVVSVTNGMTLVVDKESSRLISGSELDFEEGLNGKGFKINNPRASKCNCKRHDIFSD